jgi:hypothetical protein
MYSVATNSEEPGIIEGLRTLGEWMKMAGVLSDELPFVSASLPPTEVFEADIAGDSPHWDLYSTLRRDEPAPQAPSATPTGPPPSLVCSRRGVLVNKTGLVDKCHGYKCFITSMACDGVLYSGDGLYGYNGPMDHCEVLSMNCPSHPTQEQVFPHSCPIQKFLCPGNETKLPSELGGQSFENCEVQTYCPSANGTKHTFYGWEAFDFECTNQQLVCDGVVIENPNGYQNTNGTCEVRYVPCETVGEKSTSTCNRIESTCVTLPSENACQETLDHARQCSGAAPREYAMIEEITCPGEATHHYPSWEGSIASCTSIRSVRQSGQVIALPYNASINSYCVLTELDCGGVRTAWNFTARIPSGCGVATVVCGNSTNVFPPQWPPATPRCTTHTFGCQTAATVCTFVNAPIPCTSTCMQPGLTPQCDCPVDFKGTRCETARSILCDFNITDSHIRRAHTTVDPYPWTQDCYKDIPKRQLGEPVCHPMHHEDELFLHGKINCSFADGPLDTLLADIVTEFNYTIYADQFRISNVSMAPRWRLHMKLINYNSFTDFDGTPSVYLTTEQMVGNDTIDFAIRPSAIEDRFKTGGRIRAEWQFAEQRTSPPSMQGKAMSTATIDIMDWQPNYPKAKAKFNYRILSLVLLSLFGAFVAALFAWRYYKKKKQEPSSQSD